MGLELSSTELSEERGSPLPHCTAEGRREIRLRVTVDTWAILSPNRQRSLLAKKRSLMELVRYVFTNRSEHTTLVIRSNQTADSKPDRVVKERREVPQLRSTIHTYIVDAHWICFISIIWSVKRN